VKISDLPYKHFVGTPEGKRPLGRPMSRLTSNLLTN